MSRAGASAGADTPTSDIILPQIVPIPDTLDCLTHTSLTPHTSHQEGPERGESNLLRLPDKKFE